MVKFSFNLEDLEGKDYGMECDKENLYALCACICNPDLSVAQSLVCLGVAPDVGPDKKLYQTIPVRWQEEKDTD